MYKNLYLHMYFNLYFKTATCSCVQYVRVLMMVIECPKLEARENIILSEYI